MSVKLLSIKDDGSLGIKSTNKTSSVPVTTSTYGSCGTGTSSSSKSGAAAVVSYSSCGSNNTSTTKTAATGSASSTKYTPGNTSSTTNYSSCGSGTSYSSCGSSSSSSTKKTTTTTNYSSCGSSTKTNYSSCGSSSSNTAKKDVTYSGCGKSTSYSSCGSSSTTKTTYSSCAKSTVMVGTSSVVSTPSTYVEQIFIIEDKNSQAKSAYITSSSARYILSGSAHGASYYILQDEITRRAKETGWYIDFTFKLDSYKYKLEELTTDNLEEEIEYIENPYEPGEFFKKSSTIRLVGAANQNSYVSVSTPALSTTALSMRDVVNRFSQVNRYEDDGMIKLRGEVINGNIFNTKRRSVLLGTIRKFFFDTVGIFDILEAFRSGDALVSIYNFAKAAIELVSQEEQNTLEYSFQNRNLMKPKAFIYKLGCVTTDVEGITAIKDLPLNERFTAPKRTIIEKLVSVDQYSLNREFIKDYGLKVKENRALESAKDAVPNPNGFIDENNRAILDNTNSYNAFNMFPSNVTANALRQFMTSKEGIFLNTKVNAAVIERSVKSNNREETPNYQRTNEKKIYSSQMIKPLGKTVEYKAVTGSFSTSTVYFTRSGTEGHYTYTQVKITSFASGTTYYTKEHYSIENIIDELLRTKSTSDKTAMKSFM